MWHRAEASPVSDPGLPAVLELVEATEGSGRYVGRPGPGEPAYLLWDSGIWLWEAPDRLLLSTSTDAQVTYRVDLAAGGLVIDPDGLNAHYHRAATERPGELDELVEDRRHEEGDQAGPD